MAVAGVGVEVGVGGSSLSSWLKVEVSRGNLGLSSIEGVTLRLSSGCLGFDRSLSLCCLYSLCKAENRGKIAEKPVGIPDGEEEDTFRMSYSRPAHCPDRRKASGPASRGLLDYNARSYCPEGSPL